MEQEERAWRQSSSVPRTGAVRVVFSVGDEALTGLEDVAREHGVTAASMTAIGAFERVTLGYFDWSTKEYRDNEVDEQVEVVSFIGNMARKADGTVKVHAHLVVGKSTGNALGGHLRHGLVRPTLEVIVEELPAYLARRHDEATGLALLDLEASRTG